MGQVDTITVVYLGGPCDGISRTIPVDGGPPGRLGDYVYSGPAEPGTTVYRYGWQPYRHNRRREYIKPRSKGFPRR